MSIKKIKIKNRIISDLHKPLIIAEISANHKNSLKYTYSLIKKAAESGVEAIKFQTFDLNEMTLKSTSNYFMVQNQFKNKKWNQRSLHDLYKEAQFPYCWHKKVFKKAQEYGLICFSSVFDVKSLKFLENLNAPAYKIASLESLHFPLIKEVCKTNKPIIISTGTLSLNEISTLVKFLKKNKCKQYILLHCVTEYPAKAKNINLKVIKYLKKKYKCLVGFSDHTNGIGPAICSLAFGANVIEKHFKLSKSSNVLDKDFSLDPVNMKLLIKESEMAWESIGKEKKFLSIDEKIYKKYRRSIFACRSINKGEKFTSKNIKVVRPSGGAEPRLYEKIIGKKSKKNYQFADPIQIN